MKITIIGCGWLGLPLAKELIKKGHTVFGSTTHPDKLTILEKEGITSFLYTEKLNKEIPSVATNVSVLIINFPPSGSSNYALQIESLIKQFHENTNVLFTSSTSVYEENGNEIDENSPVLIDHPVFLAEEKIRKSNKQFTILRLAGLIGNNRHPANYLSGKTLYNGNDPVNLIHLNDVIAAIDFLIKKNNWGEIFNICWKEHPLKAKYYTNECKKLNIEPPIYINSDTSGNLINGNKIVEKLGFQYNSPI